MWVIKNKKIFLWISSLLVLGSLLLIFSGGLKFGIDFTGGSLMEIEYIDGRPDTSKITSQISTLGFGEFIAQPVDTSGFSVRTKSLTENERIELVRALSFDGELLIEEKSFTSIGPSVGRELKNKSIFAIIVVAISIILFIAYAFRGVSKPVSSWKYGIIATLTLLHDVIISTGAFVILGKIMGAEVDTLFIVAILTILGISINDTIVVFDRVRENLNKKVSSDFGEVVGKSLSETYMRSINTSLSTIIVLLALFFLGPNSTKVFSLIMAIGMFIGTYSSIFLASPLLVLAKNLQENRE